MLNKINFISMDEAYNIVKEWEKNPEAHRELYVAAENGKICAIDNTDGNCWAEDFPTLDEACKWLLNCYSIDDKIYQTDGVRIYESTITGIHISRDKIVYFTDGIAFDETAIGCTIFTTREEAEKELERILAK